MDRLRISENQKPVHKVTIKLKKALAVALAFCLVFLVACVKKDAKGEKLPSGATSLVTEAFSQEETTLADVKTTAENTSEGTSAEKTETTAKTTVSTSEKTTKPPQQVTSEKKTTAKTTAKAPAKQSEKPTVRPTETPQSGKYCFLTIECKRVLEEDNFKKLETSKKSVVPSDGVILKKTKVTFNDGDTVYDVFKRACQNNVCSHNCRYCQGRIQFETVPSAFGTYIKGIHFLYEKDCGTKSGWMYKVNGVFPDYSVDLYTVKENDDIVFVYTCDLGDV